jgi:8-oxo-dGTP pyrophosphatase MutT (NUDIX family)
MYKVFINNTPLYLTDENHEKGFSGCTIIPFESKKQLRKIINEMFSGKFKSGVVIKHFDLDELYYKLRRLTRNVPAAGGLVENELGELLFIFRKGKWDLPKGKLEKSERPDVAALREVEEECGIQQLEMVGDVWHTYHLYEDAYNNNTWSLKKTYWYLMKSDSTQELLPQLEEDITQVQWLSRKDFPRVYDNTFKSIAALLAEYTSRHMSE